ncbi:hypothetical protein D3C80_2142790 [compost metagenome]
MLPDLSREFLTRMLEGRPLAGVHIGCRDNALHYDFERGDFERGTTPSQVIANTAL